MGNKKIEKIISLLSTIGGLKKIRRTGWLNNGVRNAESVCDHSLRVCAMALFFSRELGCDSSKLVKMALVHDLHESICGDLILDYSKYGAGKGLPKQEKDLLELEAARKMEEMVLEALGRREAGEFVRLWLEAEEKKSAEARALAELDKLEMLLQAYEYNAENNGRRDLFDAFNRANGSYVKAPFLRKILSELQERDARQRKMQ